MIKKKDNLKEKKSLLNRQKIQLRKDLNKIDNLLTNTDPESPLYAKYAEQKQKLVITLYSTENDYDKVINDLSDKVESSAIDIKDIKSLIKERTEKGFFAPKEDRLSKDLKKLGKGIKDFFSLKKQREKFLSNTYDKLEDFFDSWDKIKNSYTYRFFYTGLKAGPSMVKGLGKMFMNLALTKKVNQNSFLGFKYGGQRVGRFKFNNNLLKKYSSDYKDIGKNFYMLGKGFYNRDIKKGALDAGDVITYMQSQGKDNEEILNQLSLLSKQGMLVSESYMNMLGSNKKTLEDFEDEEDFESIDIRKDVNYQNQAILIDEQNKQTLKDTLYDFYEYIDKSNTPKKKRDSIWKILKNSFVGLAKLLGTVAVGLGAFVASPIGLLIAGVIAAGVYIFGDDLYEWVKTSFKNLWEKWFGDDELSDSDFPKMDALDFSDLPTNESFTDISTLKEVPQVDATGKPISPEIREAIQLASQQTGIDPYTLAGIIQTESSFRPGATGPSTKYGQAKGLMQLLPSTFNETLGGGDIYNPQQNVQAGAMYYAKMLQMYGGDRAKALAAYNWGPGNLNRAIANYGDDWISHAPKETQDYIKKNYNYQKKLLNLNTPEDFLEQVPFSVDATSVNEYLPNIVDTSPIANSNFYTSMIKEEEQRAQARPKSIMTQNNKKQNVKTTQVAPISIPSHLGGGGLDILNTGLRI